MLERRCNGDRPCVADAAVVEADDGSEQAEQGESCGCHQRLALQCKAMAWRRNAVVMGHPLKSRYAGVALEGLGKGSCARIANGVRANTEKAPWP